MTARVVLNDTIKREIASVEAYAAAARVPDDIADTPKQFPIAIVHIERRAVCVSHIQEVDLRAAAIIGDITLIAPLLTAMRVAFVLTINERPGAIPVTVVARLVVANRRSIAAENRIHAQSPSKVTLRVKIAWLNCFRSHKANDVAILNIPIR